MRKDTINLDIVLNGEKAGKTYNELIKDSRDLNRELRNLTPGTEAFINKSEELKKVNSKLSDVRNATKGVGDELKSSSSILDQFGISLNALSFAAIIAGGFAALESIRDLAVETDLLGSKFNTVFGDAAGIVEESAKVQATALGLTINEYKRAATNAGDLLVPMGFMRDEAAALSTDLVGLSGALSAWTGGQKSSTEVSDILTKALLGEREQLKTLGISITEEDVKNRLLAEGRSKLTGTSLQQAKALATLQLITEKSADAQAGFAKGSEDLVQIKGRATAAIKSQIEAIATLFIPVFRLAFLAAEKLATGIGIVIGALIALPKFILENRVAVGSMIAGLVLFNAQMILAGANSLRLAAIEKGRLIVTTAVTVAQRLLNGAMTANPIGLVIKGIALLITAFGVAYAKSQTFRAGINGIKESAIQIFKNLKDAFTPFFEAFQAFKEGDYSGALKKIGAGILKTGPQLMFTVGKGVGDAFNKGFQSQITTENASKEGDALAKKADSLGSAEAIANANTRLDGEADGAGDDKKKGKTKNAKTAKVKEGTALPDLYSIALNLSGEIAKRRLKLLEESVKQELTATEKGFLESLFAEEEYQIQLIELKKQQLTAEEQFNVDLLEVKKKGVEEQLAYLASVGQGDTDKYKELALERLSLEKQINDEFIASGKKRTESELEQTKLREEATKREAAIKQEIISASYGAFNAGVDLIIQASGRETAERKKNAGIIKAFESGRLLVNYYAEAGGYFKSYAGLGPQGVFLAKVLSGIAFARTLLAIKTVQSQKFAFGGLLQGASHADGGIPISVGGQGGYEAEGGEAIINKKSTAQFAPILSAINSYNGNGVKFASGGITPLSLTPSTQLSSPISSSDVDGTNRKIDKLIDFLSKGLKVEAEVVYSKIQDKADTIQLLKNISSQ